MNNEEAKLLVTDVFKQIKKAESKEDLESIVDKIPILFKNKFDPVKYPDLKIYISSEEVNKLRSSNVLDNENKISSVIDFSALTPLEKLLYSVLWKNGDLGKEKHIVEGVLAAEGGDNDSAKKNGLVFYQYGKHLCKRDEPIVDQHTIRAFLLFQYKGEDDLEVTKIRKKTTLTSEELSAFKAWVESCDFSGVKNQFYVDKVLFSLGKSIKNNQKIEKRRNEKNKR